MKKMFFALAALLLAFTACTSENEAMDTPNKKEVKVTVNMDKPGFGDDSRAPRRGWEEGDQVTVVLGGYFGAYVALKYTDGEWQTTYQKYGGQYFQVINENEVSRFIGDLKDKLGASGTLEAIYFSSGLWGITDEEQKKGEGYPEYSEVPEAINLWSNQSWDTFTFGECIMTCDNGIYEIIENADSYELKLNIKLVPQVAQFTISNKTLEDMVNTEAAISVAGALSVYAGAKLTEDGFELFSVSPNDDLDWYPNATEEEWFFMVPYNNEDGVSFYASPWASGKDGIEKGTFKFSYYEYVEPLQDGIEPTLVRYTCAFTGKTGLKNGDAVIMDGPTTDGAKSKWEVKTFEYTYD